MSEVKKAAVRIHQEEVETKKCKSIILMHNEDEWSRATIDRMVRLVRESDLFGAEVLQPHGHCSELICCRAID
jgi:hypothetical protein